MDDIPVPEGLEDRVRATARAAVRDGAATHQAGRRRRRRRIAILATAALVVGGAGSAAGYWLATRDDDVDTVPAGPEARAAISESAVLARLPWLTQPGGSPLLADTEPAPSLAFPPGTPYAAALDRLLRSVVGQGRLPAGARLEAPLPAGVVWAPGSGAGAARLDLRAPFGYLLATGRIRPPDLVLVGSATRPEARAAVDALTRIRLNGGPLPASLRVAPQPLAPCQVLLPGERNATCPIAAAATR
jgi:hypothetical protein